MLTPEEYALWVQRLRLSPEADGAITTIRTGGPTRQVTSRVGNVPGTYPSVKMGGQRVPFESHRVELWAVYLMERDPQVLEFYAQPPRVPLTYYARSQRKTTPWHTPDFFVLHPTAAGWEEWKPEAALQRLAEQMPGRYQRDAQGQWRCPPGETYAERLDLTYTVRSSATVPPLLIENLRFLRDYWAKPPALTPMATEQVLAAVRGQPGITLDALAATVSLDTLYTLIATEVICTDLTTSALTRHAQVHLYPDAASLAAAQQRHLPDLDTGPSPALRWDGRIWILLEHGEQVLLQPELGPALTLPRTQFQHLLREGVISVQSASDPSPTTPEIRRKLNTASPAALAAANARYAALQAWRLGEAVDVPRRTLTRWHAQFLAAEHTTGSGYLGLLGRVSARGNRGQRIDPATLAVVETAITTWYATPQKPSAWSVYVRYRQQCEQRGLPPVSSRTFYRVLATRADAEVKRARGGRRATYADQPFYWHLDQTTPRHGERPWAIAHMDHTELDIELVSSATGKVLGRPWATFLVDAYSRRLLAVYVTYDPPSYRSVMMALRLCVKRFERLPQELVVDGGKELRGTYFEALLGVYDITRKGRPGNEPRFGSVIERLFGTANTQFIHTLRGNTQASKVPRQMTKEVNPRRLAVWTLAALAERLQVWAYEVYDTTEHPALGASPRETYDLGMAVAGARHHKRIPYAEDFLMMSRPTTHTGHVKVLPAQGITVNYLHYWHEVMRTPSVVGTSVPVRYEPFDLGAAYAFIHDQWLECHVDRYAEVHGRSEREWQSAVAEWRRQQALHGQTHVRADGKVLAEFLAANEDTELLLTQRLRDIEARGVWDTGAGVVVATRPASVAVATLPDTPPDIAALPRFEEYR